MSDGLELDHGTVEAQTSGSRAYVATSPWHARRLFGFGASDVPALLVALGGEQRETPQYIAANAAMHRASVNGAVNAYPRIVLEKAGRKGPLKAGNAAVIGTERERELIDAWRASLSDTSAIDASTVTHASIVPRELQAAIRDPECPALAASLDGWAHDVVGDLVIVEAKCSNAFRDALPWYWRAQVLAQLACTGCGLGLVVCGQQWSRGYEVRGPIHVWPVERDPADIEAIRAAVRVAWRMVETIKGGA